MGILVNAIAFIPFKDYMYGISIAFFFYYLISNSKRRVVSFNFYLFFIFSVVLSNILNQTFDSRFFNFLFLISVCSSFFYSLKNLVFKIRFMEIFFHSTIFLTAVNLICFYFGINMYQQLAEDSANALDFSGIMIHPMWLSALSGISTVVSFYYFLSKSDLKLKFLYFIFTFVSILVTVIGASRISLISSLLVVLLMLFFFEKKKLNVLYYLLAIAFLGLVSFPTLNKNSTRLRGKMEYQKDTGENSRNHLWDTRLNEFVDSPIFGVGFSAQLINGRSVTGRTESGSGWLSILSQTGFVGFLCVLMILYQSLKIYVLKGFNKGIYIYISVLVFLCMHSIAEGYILTSGYYLCFIFWLIIDILNQYNSFYRYLRN